MAERHPSRALLEVADLSVVAGSRTILDRVRLELREGEVVAVLGPSGIGKSTLLRAINRLAELDAGLRVQGSVRLAGAEVLDRGVDADSLRRAIGTLSQQPTVFPRSIRANLELPLAAHRIPRRERPARIERALRDAALWDEVEDRLDRPATILSIGQQQRLCLARALVLEPRLLLLDEPTSALDARATAAIEELVASLSTRVPCLLVTHDEAQAGRLGARCLELQPGPGGARIAPCVCSSPVGGAGRGARSVAAAATSAPDEPLQALVTTPD